MLKIGQHKTLILLNTHLNVCVGVLGVAAVAYCEPVLVYWIWCRSKTMKPPGLMKGKCRTYLVGVDPVIMSH